MGNQTMKLEQLRKWRARKDKDLSIGTSILAMRRSLKKSNKQFSQLLDAWDEFVPTSLNQRAHPVALCGGVLEVTADGAPTAYRLNRLIREGLLRQLQKKSSGSLNRIRVRIASETK